MQQFFISKLKILNFNIKIILKCILLTEKEINLKKNVTIEFEKLYGVYGHFVNMIIINVKFSECKFYLYSTFSYLKRYTFYAKQI